jgi:HPt (histidine-containing phosphotransfer) domain-containing protein
MRTLKEEVDITNPVLSDSQENVQTSLTTQTMCLPVEKPISNSVGVITKPGNENLFDLSLLEEMDNNEFVSDILTIFLGNTPKELYELKRACISNKFDAAYKMAHKIKGSTGLFQANFLLNVLIKIEETASAEKKDELAKLAELANEEYKKIEIPLKEHLRNIQARLG